MATATNHISFDNDMQIVLVKPKASTVILAECVAMILCVFSCVLTAMVTIEIPKNFTVFVSMLAFPIVVTILFNLQKHRILVVSGVLLLYGVIIYFSIQRLIQAFWMINANIIEAVNKYYGMDYGYYMPEYTFDEYVSNMILVSVLCVAFISLLFGVFIVWLKSSIGTLIFILPFAYLAIRFGKEPHLFLLILMVLGFVFTLAMDTVFTRIRGKKTSPFFVHKAKAKRSHYYCSNRQFQQRLALNSAMIVTSIVLVIVIVTSLLVPRSNYKSQEKSKEFIQQLITNGSDFGFTRIGKTITDGGIGNGKLGDVDKIRYSNEVHLIVQSDERIPMYLKGYVGAEYGGNRWKKHSDEVMKENQKMFDDFNYFGIGPQMVDVIFAFSADPNILNQSTKTNSVSVQNIAANKAYYYSPYYIKNDSEFLKTKLVDFEQDRVIEPKGKVKSAYTWSSLLFKTGIEDELETYTAFYDPSMIPLANEVKASDYYYNMMQKNPEFAVLESDYHTFVNDVYTRLPSDKLDLLKRDAVKIKGEHENDSDADKVKAVAAFLAQNTQYSLSPGRTPKGEDFAEYFLYQNKKGYCSHYATTATLMLRAMGIPARYVEGYTVTDEDYIKNEATIRDTNAHAWVEIYMSTLGWVPFEVTPGFSSGSVSGDNTDTSSDFVPSSQPNVSSQISSVDTSSGETKPMVDSPLWTSLKNGFFVFIKVLAFLIVAFLAVCIYLLVRRLMILKKRQKNYHNKDLGFATLQAYQHISLLLGFIGYHAKDHKNEQVFARYVDERCRFIEKKGVLQKVVTIALEAKYSNHEIPQEDFNMVKDFATTLSKTIYDTSSNYRKIIFKFIKVLY